MTIFSDKKMTIDTYNKTAKTHSDKFGQYGARVKDIEKAFTYINKDNPKVVEIGCGDGRDAGEILKRTNDYVGIDLSEELIKIAKKNLPDAKFEITDFETYNFPLSIDVVFAFASLLHSDKESVKDILGKVAKSLNVGGIFYISTKYGDYIRNVIDRGGPKVNFLYTPELMAKLAPENLKVVYKNIEELREQKWTEIIFQKI